MSLTSPNLASLTANLTEVGDRMMTGDAPVRFIEMDLTRLGDTDWPAAGAVPPR